MPSFYTDTNYLSTISMQNPRALIGTNSIPKVCPIPAVCLSLYTNSRKVMSTENT